MLFTPPRSSGMNYRANAWLRRQLRVSDLSWHARAVAYLIATYLDANAETRTPVTVRALAHDLGCSPRTIHRHTASLRAAGIIEADDCGQAGNRYRVPCG